MPTATSTLGWTLTNWGPLPATYTISPSCTGSTDIWIAYIDVPWAPFWPEVCVTETTEPCWPVPTEQSAFEEYANNPYLVTYHSPGVTCPPGFKSIGQAARPTNGPVTSAGIFHGYPGRWDYNGSSSANDDADYASILYGGNVAFNWMDAIGALLDSGETAIACCHSSMTVPENGVCYELLPSRPVSTACDGEWTTVESTTVVSTSYMLNGTTRTGSVVIPATASVYPLAVTSTATTFSAEETGDLVAIRLQGALILVHSGSDVPSEEEDSGEDSNGVGTEENTSAQTNVAMARFYTGDSGWGQVWGMLEAIGTSSLIGVLLALHV